jgi:branched-chain amino acid aminotransferase
MMIPFDPTTMPRLDAEAVRTSKLSGVPSDHMFISEYAHREWRKSRIQGYRPIPISPFAIGMQYAQSVFEGMKAYRYHDGRIAIFRIDRHAARFNRSLERMCMPAVPEELFREALVQLVSVDHAWVPEGPDSTLYVRPYMFASEEHVGLQPANEFLFMVLSAPFRPRFHKPIRVKVEREFVRAAPGGVGYAKCAGNYAAAMYPTQLAKEEGFDQLVWTDALTHSRVEESGAMNVMFVIDGALVTPPLSDTILDGVTRESLLMLAREAGIRVEERDVTVEELRSGIPGGQVTEAFGAGTAAIVAPIRTISIDGVDYNLPDPQDNHHHSIMLRLKQLLHEIRFGLVEDRHQWMTIVEPRA